MREVPRPFQISRESTCTSRLDRSDSLYYTPELRNCKCDYGIECLYCRGSLPPRQWGCVPQRPEARRKLGNEIDHSPASLTASHRAYENIVSQRRRKSAEHLTALFCYQPI